MITIIVIIIRVHIYIYIYIYIILKLVVVRDGRVEEGRLAADVLERVTDDIYISILSILCVLLF